MTNGDLEQRLVRESFRRNVARNAKKELKEGKSHLDILERYHVQYHGSEEVPRDTLLYANQAYIENRVNEIDDESFKLLSNTVKEDHNKAIDFVEREHKSKGLLEILNYLPLSPKEFDTDALKKIQQIHNAYFNARSAVETGNEEAQLDIFMALNGYRGGTIRDLKEIYAANPNLFKLRMKELLGKLEGELYKLFKTGEIETDKGKEITYDNKLIKDYISKTVEGLKSAAQSTTDEKAKKFFENLEKRAYESIGLPIVKVR